jgi:hypothetical protein
VVGHLTAGHDQGPAVIEPLHGILAAGASASALNSGCYCRTLNPDVLRARLASDARLAGLMDGLQATHPHLFSSVAVFLSPGMAQLIQSGVAALERVIRLPGYQALALGRAPPIAQFAFGPVGAFMSYDFHLGPDGPRLIEINTNAGGALLNVALAGAQQACCEAMAWAFESSAPARTPEQRFMDMFLREWHLQRGEATLKSLLVVDDDPGTQYLAPEFELFRQLFEQHGLRSQVADPRDLAWRDGALWHQGLAVDMIYNRLTDFHLSAPGHAAVRSAYEAGAVVLTPGPRAHALHADKRNLVPLSDDALLGEWGVSTADREELGKVVPRSWLVDARNADELWARRRSLFFKPAAGFGAKAAYRGDKLTRRVWGEILAGSYIAQALVPPTERLTQVEGIPARLKFDVRAYAYEGEILLLAARLYAGQTTNFRTPGGGFAAVIVVPGNPAP